MRQSSSSVFDTGASSSPAFTGLNAANISNWNCSIAEYFDNTFPPDFKVPLDPHKGYFCSLTVFLMMHLIFLCRLIWYMHMTLWVNFSCIMDNCSKSFFVPGGKRITTNTIILNELLCTEICTTHCAKESRSITRGESEGHPSLILLRATIIVVAKFLGDLWRFCETGFIEKG